MHKHPFEPLYDNRSKLLILGSFPSVKSREQMFFYGHPQNRFWKVIAAVLGVAVPQTIEQKRQLLLMHRIALWDVIAACEITGSADSSIQNVTPNDLTMILQTADIHCIVTNGKTAYNYFCQYIEKRIGRGAICLPSTSPANAVWSLDRLVDAWGIIKPYTQEN